MANQAPAFQFYPRDFVADVQHMSAEQVGAYWLILCAAWNGDRPGYLPNDPEILAPIGKLDAKGWKRCEKAIMRALKVSDDGAWVYSKRMADVFEEQQANRSKKSDAGKKGAEARWQPHATAIDLPLRPQGDGNTRPIANDSSASASASAGDFSLSPVRVMGRDEQQAWSAAWESADLPGSPLLVSVIAEWRRTPEKQRPTPEAACVAYKAKVDQQRADGLRAHVGAEHMLRCWGDIVDAARGAVPKATHHGGKTPEQSRPKIPNFNPRKYADEVG